MNLRLFGNGMRYLYEFGKSVIVKGIDLMRINRREL